MTPSQINRAVLAALHHTLPELATRLRWELGGRLQVELATTPERLARVAPAGPAWEAHWAAVVAPLDAPPSPTPAPRENAPPVAAMAIRQPALSKFCRRLTPEQITEIWRLSDEGLNTVQIGARIGFTGAAVAIRLRQPRPATASPVPVEPPPPARSAPQPSRRHSGGRDLSGSTTPRAALESVPARGLEPVPSSHDDAADWLTGALQRERLSPAEIEQRLAILTPAGVLRECNTRRRTLGLPPYQVIGRAA